MSNKSLREEIKNLIFKLAVLAHGRGLEESENVLTDSGADFYVNAILEAVKKRVPKPTMIWPKGYLDKDRHLGYNQAITETLEALGGKDED